MFSISSSEPVYHTHKMPIKAPGSIAPFSPPIAEPRIPQPKHIASMLKTIKRSGLSVTVTHSISDIFK